MSGGRPAYLLFHAGVGFGKISVSILFKGVMANMPRELSGWETGTICVTKPIRVEPVEGSDFDWREKKLLLSTLEAKEKLSSRHATLEGNTLMYDVDEDEPIRLPTYDRYSSALYFDYGGSKIHISKFGKVRDAFATCCELHDPVGTPGSRADRSVWPLRFQG